MRLSLPVEGDGQADQQAIGILRLRNSILDQKPELRLLPFGSKVLLDGVPTLSDSISRVANMVWRRYLQVGYLDPYRAVQNCQKFRTIAFSGILWKLTWNLNTGSLRTTFF